MIEAILLYVALQATAPKATIDDMVFVMATEDVVRSEHPGAIPEPYKGLIAKTGDPCWRCRELATRRLLRASKQDWRWLFWGSKHEDGEIRLRCNRLLREMTLCPECEGTGSVSIGHWDEVSGDWTHKCRVCKGRRSAWAFTIWD